MHLKFEKKMWLGWVFQKDWSMNKRWGEVKGENCQKEKWHEDTWRAEEDEEEEEEEGNWLSFVPDDEVKLQPQQLKIVQ